MAWTVGSAQTDAELGAKTPFLERTSTRAFGAGLAVAVVLSFFGQAWALWLWGLAVGAGLAFQGWRGMQEAKPPEDGPCFAISTIKEGPIEVVGRIVPPKRCLLSPLTSTKCCYFDYRVALLDDEGNETEILDSGNKRCDFWLKDITGKIKVVHSDDLEIDYERQIDTDLRAFDLTPRPIRERFEKLKIHAYDSPGDRVPMWLSELRLDPGDNVIVRGTARRGDDGEMWLVSGPDGFKVSRYTGPMFIPKPAEGAKLTLALGAVVGVASLIALLV